MANPPTPAAPAAKKKTAKAIEAELRAEILALTAERDGVAATASELNKQVEGYRSAQTKHEEELRDVEHTLSVAKAGLKSFQKLKEWKDQWPPLEVSPIRPITFGDLKGAYEAAVALFPANAPQKP